MSDESVLIEQWIGRYRPDARAILDVACGTGARARLLAARGFLVDGGDMATLALGRRYDAVLCLLGPADSVGTPDDMDATLSQLAHHLDDNGVMLVEPWLTPDELRPVRAFERAGLDVAYDATGISGRGLYIARHRRVC